MSQAALTLGALEDTYPDALATVSLQTRPATEPSRVVAVQSPPAGSQLPALTTVASILQRLRQVKTVILDRALAVDLKDVERFAWLKRIPNAGVTRVLNRVTYGAEFSLPWMREGGSYFSFTENVHDFNRRPQVSYSGGYLMAGGRENALLDLGPVSLESIGTTPTWNGRVPNTVDAAEYAIAWTTVDPSHPQLKTLADHRVRASDAAKRLDGTSSQDLQAILRGRRRLRLVSRIGHAFLMRVRAKAEYDALIAFEVVRADDDGCTLAWRVLKTWPIEDERSLWKPRMLRSALPEPPAAIVAMANADLRDELVLALEAADERLFQTFPVEIESRFGHLRGQPQCGLARLLPYLGPWTELCNAPAHGSVLSPFDGDHDSQYSYIGFQGSGRSARLHPGLDGGVFGIVADLGKIDLDTVTRASTTGLGGVSGDIALTHKFEQLAYEPNRPKFDEDRWKLRRTNQMAFRKKLEENGVRESAVAAVGRTYRTASVQEPEF